MPLKELPVSRNSSFELFRIIASIGVIFIHFEYLALFDMESVPALNKAVLIGGHSIVCCAVDFFIMLFGFFSFSSKKTNLYKPFELLIRLFVYRFLISLIQIVLGNSEFTLYGLLILLIPNEYFIVLYAVLYIVSPYINYVLENLSEKKMLFFVAAIFCVFSIWNFSLDVIGTITGIETAFATSISHGGSGNGYTITNFMLCYIIGAALGKKVISIKKPAIVFAACTVINFAFSWYSFGLGFSYCSPFVIAQAAAVIAIAERFHYRNKAINTLARISFSVFILHMHVIIRFRQQIVTFAQTDLAGMFFVFAKCVVITFAFSYVFHFAFDYLMKPLLSSIKRKLEKVEFSIP